MFVSPKVGKKLSVELVAAIDFLQEYMDGKGYHYSFKLIMNEQFTEEILKPVCDISDKVADTSELFMRSYQLMKVFD